MKLGPTLVILTAFVTAAVLSTVGAILAADLIERRTAATVNKALTLQGYDSWIGIRADGLQVALTGVAPDEATRFRALTIAGGVVDADRLIDAMDVAEQEALDPLRFSLEILRNTDGISLIGLIPASTDRQMIVDTVSELTGTDSVTDMLDSAADPAPDGWALSLAHGLEALRMLPRSKISIRAGRIDITAISDSSTEKRRLETDLMDSVPEGVELILDISAPRPVITPFTLRFTLDSEGARFDACSAASEGGRRQILTAASEAGLEGQASCTLGLGVPSPNWPNAVSLGIKKLKELGGGSITFSDADVTLVALDTTSQTVFDRVVGELETDLPDVFSLEAVLPEKVELDGTGENEEIIEFVATRDPEGEVQLRGRLNDERLQAAVDSYARSHFGSGNVYAATRTDPELPDGWPIRVMAGLEAMSELKQGTLIVQTDFVSLKGETGNAEAKENMSRILSAKLGDGQNFDLDITYLEVLDPLAALPTPEECVLMIQTVLSAQKISFEPGSADISPSAFPTMDRIAEVLRDCPDVPIEIAGHTDSQGREVMNLNLSQARAEAVLNALIGRRILTSSLVTKGYGETDPIADNDTEEGREANRRIEFNLLEATDVPAQTESEDTAQSSEGADE